MIRTMAARRFVVGVAIAVLSAAGAAAGGATEHETVTVISTGVVEADRYQTWLTLSVESIAVTATEASRRTERRSAELVDALVADGVSRRDITTTWYSIYREQVPVNDPRLSEDGAAATADEPRIEFGGPDGSRFVTRSVARTSLRVVVRDVARAGTLIERAIEAGARDVNVSQLRAAEAEALYEVALAEAVEGARAKAERMARVEGRTVGALVELSEVGPGSGGPMFEAAVYGRGAGGPDLEPGSPEVRAMVRATFRLE